MNHRLILAALLICVCTVLPALGQTKPADDQDDVVKITTNLVQIDAVVTKDGKPVPGLKAEDFEIYEDGRRQTITNFAYISNVAEPVSTAPDKGPTRVPRGSYPLFRIRSNAMFPAARSRSSSTTSFVYLNAANLTFARVNDRHETSLELHGIIFGDNGAIVEQIKHGAVLNLRQSEYEQAMRDGLRLRFDMPAKLPGSYQVRIAVRDRNSSKVGAAGQFVAVPDLKNNRLAMSGIVLRAAGENPTQTAVLATPASRFQINSDLYFAFVIYNATIDPATQLPNLVMETKLFRDGKSVKSAAETAINGANQSDLARLLTTGMVRLDPDLEPGNYYLQVVITDKFARNQQPPVTQWVNFEIVK